MDKEVKLVGIEGKHIGMMSWERNLVVQRCRTVATNSHVEIDAGKRETDGKDRKKKDQ